MPKTRFSLKTIGAAAVFGIASIAVASAAHAQSTSLNSILQKIRTDSTELNQEGQARLQEFRQKRDEQKRLFDDASAELRRLQAEGTRLSNEFDVNEARLGELQAELEAQAGDFGELLGQFRTAAGETMPIIRTSFSNFDPSIRLNGGLDRVDKLSAISQARTLPTRADLDSLPKAILLEMVAQSEVKAFTAPVANIGAGGATEDVELLRIGVFTAAVTDGTKFVEVIDPQVGDNFLEAFKAQPGGPLRSAMTKLISAGPDAVVKAPVDPSKGNLFGIEGEFPGLDERIAQGGPVGAVILALLVIGAIIAIFKIVTLLLMGGAMRSTAKTRQAGDGNPLARVFEAYEQHKGDDMETLELKLDEQILKESPKIERFNDILKVLSAVAPLLGLLGTVIGMIITFTSITIYGAGDPKLMAGGISTALMTTVLGLVAAIPLLLMHAVASSIARGNQQILDEQAAGLVAERAEQEGVAA